MKTLRDTKLGDIVKINGVTYVVCVYRTNYKVELVPVAGITRSILLDIDMEVI